MHVKMFTFLPAAANAIWVRVECCVYILVLIGEIMIQDD